ncbi:hypothetical protein Zm00014a_036868 [Zea mays]|uniref:DUF6857 domain-containing protein n=1 Tax=Zea mays TaxID=4577 RepID=A0A3L6ECS5_MAIZE|nr:hypothetical protein Zm00014a_036868 [Zea mays]
MAHHRAPCPPVASCRDDVVAPPAHATREVESEKPVKNSIMVEQELLLKYRDAAKMVAVETMQEATMAEILVRCLRVEVVDLTEGGKKEQNLGAETEHDRGNAEAELGALGVQEQNLNARARLTAGVCRHKVTADEVTEATEGVVSAAHVLEDGTTVTPGTRRSTDHQYSKSASDSSTAVGSSKGLNASLKRLYRSMNVPVPCPLPSLVQLMAASKRPRVSNCAAVGSVFAAVK